MRVLFVITVEKNLDFFNQIDEKALSIAEELSIVFQLERQGEGQGRVATPAAAASTTGGVSGAIRAQAASLKFLQAEPDMSHWQKHNLILKGLKGRSVFYSEAAETPV